MCWDNLEGWLGGSRGRVYLWLIHIVVSWKLTQQGKAIILQIKIKKQMHVV